MEEEIRAIRKKLSFTPKQIDEELLQRLMEIKNYLKAKMEDKSFLNQKINILEQEINQNSTIKEELTNALITQRRVLRENETKMKSLKDEIAKLQLMLENTGKEKIKQVTIRQKKFQDIEKNFDKVVKKSETLGKQLTDSKRRLEMRRKLQQEKSPVFFIRKSLSTYPKKIKKIYLGSQSKISHSESSIEIPDDQTDLYKKKLLLYQSIFRVLCERNQDKVKNAVDLINETKEWTSAMVEKRCLMLQLTSEIQVLTIQSKKLKKNALYPTKQKYVKKKNSSQQMVEFLNEKKTYLAIKRKENECLKSLIMNVLASKEDDCNLFQSYLMKNKDIFLKELTGIKLLNAP